MIVRFPSIEVIQFKSSSIKNCSQDINEEDMILAAQGRQNAQTDYAVNNENQRSAQFLVKQQTLKKIVMHWQKT